MTEPTSNAPAPDSAEFLENQNTVDKQSPPDTSADEAGNDPEAFSTDPATSSDAG